MEYKARVRIPTDTYAYIEIDVEGSLDDIFEAQRLALQKLLQRDQPGAMPDRDFNVVLDDYIYNDKISAEAYDSMSTLQKDIIQCIKRSKNRDKR